MYTPPTLILQAWHFCADKRLLTPVLPDGCRDLIVKTDSHGEPQWFVSDLAESTEHVVCEAGQAFSGFRFHPAARIAEKELLAAFRHCEGSESKEKLIIRMEEFVVLNNRLAEALDSLSVNYRIAQAAQGLGVSERTLERLVKQATGHNPVFWKSLARARKAARQLNSEQPLAELASDYGYADQAHMTREFKKWFGVAPNAFLQQPNLGDLIRESGYN